jgi:hypothetical protein
MGSKLITQEEVMPPCKIISPKGYNVKNNCFYIYPVEWGAEYIYQYPEMVGYVTTKYQAKGREGLYMLSPEALASKDAHKIVHMDKNKFMVRPEDLVKIEDESAYLKPIKFEEIEANAQPAIPAGEEWKKLFKKRDLSKTPIVHVPKTNKLEVEVVKTATGVKLIITWE